VRRTPWLAPVLFAACAMPPRVDDQSTPLHAYETFRGAMARDEYDRAYATLSDQLRGKYGLKSRATFTDGMIIGGGVAVKAIRRSKAQGPVERLPDGRALLRVRLRYLVFGKDVRIWLRPVPVVRAYVEGREAPFLYDQTDRFELGEAGGIVGVRLSPDLRAELEKEVRAGRVRRFEAGIDWFLDDFEVGGTPPERQERVE
jgi:hypothetical protein